MARIPGGLEAIHQSLYDSNLVATGAVGSLSFFTVPQGQTGSGYAAGKTLLETNMRQAGQIPAPGSFEVRGFSCAIRSGTVFADAQVLADQCAFVCFVDAKNMFEMAPIGKLGGGSGTIVTAQTTAAATTGVSLGIPDPRAIYTLAAPFTIEASQSFRCEIFIPVAITLSASSRIYVYIEGVYSRAIQ